MKLKTKKTLIILATLTMLMLNSCFYNNNNPPTPPSGIYTGYTGVDANFINPPTNIIYSRTAGKEGNEVDFDVDIRNVGSSLARGGIYLSGFDPNMFEFEDILIDEGLGGACSLDVSNLMGGHFGAIFRCGGTSVGRNDRGGIDFRTNDFGGLIDGLFGTHISSNKLFKKPVRLDVSTGKGGDVISFSFDNVNFEYAKRGRLFIALFAGLDFARYNGFEYMLDGDTSDFPGGESTIHTFRGYIKEWPKGGNDVLTQNLLLTNCYLYTTYAAPTVCIDPEPYSNSRKVCSPNLVINPSNGQGAPIAITNVQEIAASDKVQFLITIQNQGGGDLFDPGYMEYCSPYRPGRVTSNMLDTVYIGDVRIGAASTYAQDPRLRCTPSYKIRLRNGRAQFSCVYDISRLKNLKSAFQTSLIIELWYGYRQEKMLPIRLQRI